MRMAQLLTKELRPEIRRPVLVALTTSPLLVKRWAEESGCDGTDDNGCPEVVAAFAAIGQPINARLIMDLYKKSGDLRVELQVSLMLGGTIPTDVLHQAWTEWDNATVQERSECVQEFHRALARLDEEDECDAPDVPIRRDLPVGKFAKSAVLVVACLCLFLGGALF
jgi:hypothetical protein